MSQCRLALVGFSGRMGAELRALATDCGFRVTAGVARKSGTVDGIKVVSTLADLGANEIDVVIDFSMPEIFEDVVSWCAQERKPLVSGVTGITTAHRDALARGAKSVAILWAPNMSLGVAVFAKMLEQFSSLEEFDFQIEELHHNRKKDRPSGTAGFLQEKLIQTVKKKVPEPLAIRGGGVFGIHRVWAMGEEELLTIEHTAMNRRVFARGALRAADWIKSKSPGLYGLGDTF
jgi:4-hydroxy-tetrahydrodipicolinate reductase